MKILLACAWPLDAPGGVATFVRSLADEFRALGHSCVALVAPGPLRPALEEGPGGAVYRMKIRSPARRPSLLGRAAYHLGDWVQIRALRRLVAGCDVVNLHFPTDSYLALVQACRREGVPLVVSVHGSDLEGGAGREPAAARALAEVLAQAACVVHPGRTFMERWCERIPQLKGRSVVVRGGVANDFMPPDWPALPAGPRLLCVANLTAVKGHVHLLEAWRQVLERVPDARLTLAGDGPLLGALEQQVAALGLEQAVRFLGRVSHEELPALLLGSSATVLASLREGLPLVVLESLACGRPVVASRVGGIHEVVQEGVNGLLVPPGDPQAMAGALAGLLSDGARLESMARKAHAEATGAFSWRRSAREYLDLYAGLSSGASASA